MTIELTLLGWTLVLALVQVLLPAAISTLELGVKYNVSARDDQSVSQKVSPITARLRRAQANLFETLPVFAAAILIAHVAGRENDLTAQGAWMYLIARIVYIPLYAFGVPYARSAVWTIGFIGIVRILEAVLL